MLIPITVCLGVGLPVCVQTAAGSPNSADTALFSPSSLGLEKSPAPDGIWVDNSVGEGFRAGQQEFGVGLGVGFASPAFGSRGPHDMVLSRFYYGLMLGDVVGEDKWYRGNWEVVEEFFAGGQFRPAQSYVIGETTLLRFNFATGTRWVPFVDAGVGISVTDIGSPDLGSIFEFNWQAGPGVNYFWRRNSALTLQYRFIHFSNAGIRQPNVGVNESMFYAGVSCFF
jgi:lipid A 3-O-deacylase